ncbi:hypothetical protein ACFE04_004983 [Oxalis oulophora]
MALVTTAEVCDANPQLIVSGELRALQPNFQIYGRRQVFCGPIVTLKVFEDNVLVREFLEEKGNGRVLVVDGGASMRCAILGGNPVVQAQNNGWAGILVNGCVRDVDEINGCDIGVRALASHPMKANKKGIGEKHVPITVAGTRICDGEWLYADTDGILISRTELSVALHLVIPCSLPNTLPFSSCVNSLCLLDDSPPAEKEYRNKSVTRNGIFMMAWTFLT